MIACDGFLDEKPSLSLVVPTTLADFEALLNNDSQVFNISPAIGEIASADYFTTLQRWQTYATMTEREAYIWGDEVNNNGELQDWTIPYTQIFYANVVIDGIKALNISQSQKKEADRLIGTAKFFRAFAYHNLIEIFTEYSRFDDADEKIGVPLRTSSNLQDPIFRASLSDVKSFMKNDLMDALSLLPEIEALRTLPTKQSALSLLMRIHFMEGDYQKALEYGLEAMQYPLPLIDYTSLTPTTGNPFQIFNEEVMFHSQLIIYNFFNSPLTFVSPDLLDLYEDGDARIPLFFINRGTGGLNFKAFHTGRITWFGGIGTNEVFITVSECFARSNRLNEAANSLNALLLNRIHDFKPITFQNQEEAILLILKERRKELLFRGLRWMDLKRLNYEGANITLRRELGETIINLEPNSKKYVFPIPPVEIERSGIAQNLR